MDTKVSGRRIVLAYTAACIAGLAAAIAILVTFEPSRPDGYDSFPLSAVSFGEADDGWTVYDDEEVYWVFSHREQLCAAAAEVGTDGVVVSTLEAGAITEDEVMYLRGMLRGCATR